MLLHSHRPFRDRRVYAYHGSSNGLAASPAWTAESDQASASFGFSVSSGGDVNGDGYSDVIVGAYRYDDGETDEGRAYAYHGSSSGLAMGPAWTTASNQPGAGLGYALSTAGDVNGDGYSDVIVGAYGYDGGETDEGRAYAYHGSSSGLAASPAWTAESDQAIARLGVSVSSAGDVNGDGYSDVIVGTPQHDNGQSDEGRAWIYLGNEGDGGLVREGPAAHAQRRAPAVGPGLDGRERPLPHPLRVCDAAGYSWASPEPPMAHLEWEVKPLGVSFDGTGIQSGTNQPLTPSGGTVTFNEIAFADDEAGDAHTAAGGSYHWRARVATNNPLFPHTAWFSPPGTNINEAMLRKPDPPGPLPW